MQMLMWQLVCCILLSSVSAMVVWECAAPDVFSSLLAATRISTPIESASVPEPTTMYTLMSTSSSSKTASLIVSDNLSNSTTASPVTTIPFSSNFASTSSFTIIGSLASPSLSVSSSSSLTSIFIPPEVPSLNLTTLATSTSTTSSRDATTLTSNQTTSTTTESIVSSTTTTTTSSTTAATTSPASLTITTQPSKTTNSLATSVQAFTVRAGDSGTAADGQIMEGTQADDQILVFNPFEPGPTAQSYRLDTTTGYVYDGAYRLCVENGASKNPASVLTCDAATADDFTRGRQSLVCDITASRLRCSVVGSNRGAVYTVFSLFTENGMQELMIGTEVSSNYAPVSLYVGFIIQ